MEHAVVITKDKLQCSRKSRKIENKTREFSRPSTKAPKLLKRNQNVIYITSAFRIRSGLEGRSFSIALRLLFRESRKKKCFPTRTMERIMNT